MSDWVGILTALATLILAGLTYVLARATRHMASHTESLANATVELAEETRRIAEQTRRYADAAEQAAHSGDELLRIDRARRAEELKGALRVVEWTRKRGIVLKNGGKGTAIQIQASSWTADRAGGGQTMHSNAVGLSAGPGEEITSVDLRMDPGEYTDADKMLPPLRDGVLASWINDDGSDGTTGWKVVDRKG